jgi:two-component system KDP operon response regulator KdpE
VLVVEDEPGMRKLLHASLAANGFRVVQASTVAEALSLAPSHNPELILLDLGLPDGDGLDLTRRFREWTQVPILVISARGRDDDKVTVLDAGADDYVTKPFSMNELLARMRVALRHAAQTGAEAEQSVAVGPIRIDLTRRVVTIGDDEIHMTPIEYRLLVYLAKHEGKVLTHRQILREVWGPGHGDETSYLRVYMLQLRRKLERDPSQPRLLLTEPGVGYRLRDPAR